MKPVSSPAAFGPVFGHKATPFASAEDAWFWFMRAHEARLDGARYASHRGAVSRPCEPVDIFRIMDRLHRTRILKLDHFRVLRHYGQRQMAPERWRRQEMLAHTLWAEAMTAMADAFEAKGIIAPRQQKTWAALQADLPLVTPLPGVPHFNAFSAGNGWANAFNGAIV